MGVGTSIIGRRRLPPRQRRADLLYTLNCQRVAYWCMPTDCNAWSASAAARCTASRWASRPIASPRILATTAAAIARRSALLNGCGRAHLTQNAVQIGQQRASVAQVDVTVGNSPARLP